MIIDFSSLVIILGITGLGILFYELWLKFKVSAKGIRVFFYFLLVLQLLALTKVSFLREVNFIGQPTVLNLESYTAVSKIPEYGGYNVGSLLWLIYLVGFGIGITKLSIGILKLLRLIGESATGKNKFERIVNASDFLPCTFFKYIFIPVGLPNNVYLSIYKHEKYHAEQMHSLDMILWHMMSIVFWFNPFVHMLKSRQSQNLEYDTDLHMIKSIPKDQYARHLLNSTFRSYEFNFNPTFNRSKIYSRMKRLNENRKRNKLQSRITLGLTFIILFGGLIMSKASFITNGESNISMQVSKPEFPPNGHGDYIESKLQQKIGNRFDDIHKDFDLQLILDITIDEKGNVAEVKETARKTNSSNDPSFNNYLSDLLVETIENMPSWVPAQENGKNVSSTIQEEFHFSGSGE